MKTLRGFSVVLVLGLASPVILSNYSFAAYPAEAEYAAGEVLVKYKSGVASSKMHSFDRGAGASAKENLPSPGLQRIKLSPSVSVEDAIDEYYRRGGDSIEYAEPNYIVNAELIPNDSEFHKQWALDNTGQDNGTAGADIDAPGAWDLQSGNGLVVAVIDTGVDYNHPDLAANIWTNNAEIPDNGVDDDDNGYVDDYRGWDFINNDNNPYDDHSHGTHISGAIAAVSNNGSGVTGVCWNAKIMPLKFLGADGGGSVADAIKAIHYAAIMGAKVMNNSWGGGSYSQALKDAIEEARSAGAIFVAAAGNSAANNDQLAHYPSGYDCSNIIAVAATDNNDLLAGFSCYGITTVDIGAPGVGILSTVPGGGYSSYSGTSMAAPHVAGAVALAWSHFPEKSYSEIISDVLGGAEPASSLNGKVSTGGRLNLRQAIDPENDSCPPSAVADLGVSEARMSRVMLQWTASGDDGTQGQASAYDIRYSREPINDSNWNNAALFACPLSPHASGTAEEATVDGLLPGTLYYFALKIRDNRGNISGISNVVSASTGEGAVVLDDSVENGDNGWTASGLWHRTTHRSSSPGNSWYYGREGYWTYDTGEANSGTLTSRELDLSGYDDAILTFSYFRQVESYGGAYDITAVQASRDGGVNWTDVWKLDASSPSGESWVDSPPVILSDFAGARVMLRFSFDSRDSNSNQYEGWYIDNIRLMAESRNGNENMYLHGVHLSVNKESFQSGDTLTLSATLKRGEFCSYSRCSAYLAVALPNGRLLFLTGNGAFSDKMTAVVKDFAVSDARITVGSFAIPPDIQDGQYTWMAVLAIPQKSAARTSSWASNLAESDFFINR